MANELIETDEHIQSLFKLHSKEKPLFNKPYPLDYPVNQANFSTSLQNARFFVIKSFSEDDIQKAIKHGVWCSTRLGNRKLNEAYLEADGQYPIYLFFSANGSRMFQGVAEMTSTVDETTSFDKWTGNREWSGLFSIKWVFIKDLPNAELRHITLVNNDNKPITNSRDTQEIPFIKGLIAIRVFKAYQHNTSILDDFDFYENQHYVRSRVRS